MHIAFFNPIALCLTFFGFVFWVYCVFLLICNVALHYCFHLSPLYVMSKYHQSYVCKYFHIQLTHTHTNINYHSVAIHTLLRLGGCLTM